MYFKYNNAKRSILAHLIFVNDAHPDIQLWPVTSIINRVYRLTMVNMSAKFDEEAHMVKSEMCSQAYFHTCQLWPWPLTYDLQNQKGPSSHYG